MRTHGSKAAELLQAEGFKTAAELLQTSKVAVTMLETIKSPASEIQYTHRRIVGFD
jgi:hypothetical protein